MNPESVAFLGYGLIAVVIAAISCFVYWAVFGGDDYDGEMSGENMFGGIATGLFWPFGIFFLLFFLLLLAGKKITKLLRTK